MDALFQHTDQWVIVVDQAGRLMGINPALQTALGHASLPASLSSLFSASSQASLPKFEDVAGVSNRSQVAFAMASGENLPARGKWMPGDWHGQRCVLGVFSAATDENLEAQQLAKILKVFPDVLLVLDRTCHYRHVFSADTGALVSPREELLGKTLWDVMPAEEARPGAELIAQVLDTGQPAETTHTLTLGGKKKWFSARVVPFSFNNAEDPCVLWLSRDVSEAVALRRRRAAHSHLLRELLRLQEHERQMLAGEMHDGFVQYVVGARMWLESLQDAWAPANAETHSAVSVIRDSLDQAVSKAREMINSLRPVVAECSGIDMGLRAVVEQFKQRGDFDIRFEVQGNVGPLSPLLESAIIRICYEALNNAVRHSQANKITVRIQRHDHEVQLVIGDDGVGFDSESVPSESRGVESIFRRAQVFGGTARIDSGSGTGTKVQVTLPALPPDEDESKDVERLSSIMIDRAEASGESEAHV